MNPEIQKYNSSQTESDEEINEDDIKRCLEKSVQIQWGYKNIVKRKGELIQIKK